MVAAGMEELQWKGRPRTSRPSKHGGSAVAERGRDVIPSGQPGAVNVYWTLFCRRTRRDTDSVDFLRVRRGWRSRDLLAGQVALSRQHGADAVYRRAYPGFARPRSAA